MLSSLSRCHAFGGLPLRGLRIFRGSAVTRQNAQSACRDGLSSRRTRQAFACVPQAKRCHRVCVFAPLRLCVKKVQVFFLNLLKVTKERVTRSIPVHFVHRRLAYPPPAPPKRGVVRWAYGTTLYRTSFQRRLNQEMVDDLISIVSSFSARIYGSHGERVAKKVATLLEEEKCIE